MHCSGPKKLPTLILMVLLGAWLTACATTAPPSATLPAMGIVGTVSDQAGNPVPGAVVYAYRNDRSHLRGPADFEANVAADGYYCLDLVEGSYFLVARQRQSGADAGPPQTGDAWALPKHNPVTVFTDQVVNIDFVLQEVRQPHLMREGTLTSGDTGFTGLLVDNSGKPVPGAFVLAFPQRDFHRMPEATSPAVGRDGRFYLYLERPGQWCLAARTETRGQPTIGEPYGVLESCRFIESGQILDIGEIRLKPYRR